MNGFILHSDSQRDFGPFAFIRDYIVKLKLAFVFPGLGVLGEAVKQ